MAVPLGRASHCLIALFQNSIFDIIMMMTFLNNCHSFLLLGVLRLYVVKSYKKYVDWYVGKNIRMKTPG